MFYFGETEARGGTSESSRRPAWPEPRLGRLLLGGQWEGLKSGHVHLVCKSAGAPRSRGVTGEPCRAGGDSPSDSEAALKIR